MIEAVLKEHNAVGIENALTITELCILARQYGKSQKR